MKTERTYKVGSNLVILSFLMAIIGCSGNSKKKADQDTSSPSDSIATNEQPAVDQPSTVTSQQTSASNVNTAAIKLVSEDCIDPDLANVLVGTVLMLCDGTVQEGTLVPPDVSNLTPGNIKRGVTIAGVRGKFPSTEFPLPRFTSSNADINSTAAVDSVTTDLTDFSNQLGSDSYFEYWDETGIRYTNKGDSDLIATNVKSGVILASLAVTGAFTGTYPSSSEVKAGTVFGPNGNEYTGTKHDTKICKDGKGVTSSGGDATTPWDNSSVTNSNSSTDDYQNGADPWYAGVEASNCNENNFTEVTGQANFIPDDSARVAGGGQLTWSNIYQDSLTGLYFTNILAKNDASALLWEPALDLCVSLNGSTAGNGWRLPTQKELMQLYIDGISKFASIGSLVQSFWSSTSVSWAASNTARTILLVDGDTSFRSKVGADGVICVRE